MVNSQNVHDEGPSGISGGVSRLKANAGATAEELREFIGQIHEKSPQEILGAVAESGLARGIAASALGAFVLLAVFTVGPFLMNRQPADAAPTAEAGQKAAVQAQPDQIQPTNTEPQADVTSAGTPAKADLEKATNAMGIGEVKTAEPDSNPLDKKLDSLLDGVD